MRKQPLTILGINPGTRYLGFAVFLGPQLIDWGVKVTKGRWSKEKMGKVRKIVSNLVKQYGPNVLAIKRLHPSRNSPHLKQLASNVREHSRRKGLKVYQYSIEELEAFFSLGERTNKKEMAEMVAMQYPALLHELKREKGHRNPYHIRMFEAVALGAACFHQLDKY